MNAWGKPLLTALLLSSSATVSASVELGEAALANGQEAQAIAYFKTANSDPNAQIALAKLYLGRDLDEAEEWIEKALKQAPNNAEAHFTLGVVRGNQAQNALFSALSLAKKSKRAFEKAVELEPQSLKYLRGLLQYHVNAPSIAGGSLEEAAKIAARMAAIDPIAGVLANIDVVIAEDEPEQTLKALNTALEAHPDNADVNFKAGMFYQRQEDFAQAFTLFEAASQVDNASVSAEDGSLASYAAIYQLGRTAVLSNSRHAEGIGAFQRYLQHAPDDADLPSKSWAEFRMADLMDKSGQKDQALAIFQRLLKSEDDDLRKQVKKRI